MWIKVCGLRDTMALDAAVEAGADAVGFVFAPGSPRTIDAEEAAALVRRTPEGVRTVGVFRRQPVDEVIRIATIAGVSTVQLHGDEPAGDFAAVKARGLQTVRATSAQTYLDEDPQDRDDRLVDLLLIDAPTPGSGRTFDTRHIARTPPARDWILAGGLHPGNVAEAIATARPWGVDVSSGVESAPGVKDPGLIREFVAAARLARPSAAALA